MRRADGLYYVAGFRIPAETVKTVLKKREVYNHEVEVYLEMQVGLKSRSAYAGGRWPTDYEWGQWDPWVGETSSGSHDSFFVIRREENSPKAYAYRLKDDKFKQKLENAGFGDATFFALQGDFKEGEMVRETAILHTDASPANPASSALSAV